MDETRARYALTRGAALAVAFLAIVVGLLALRPSESLELTALLGIPLGFGLLYAVLVYVGAGPFRTGT